MTPNRPEPLTPQELSKALAEATEIVEATFEPLRFRLEVRDGIAFFMPAGFHGHAQLPAAAFSFATAELNIVHRTACYSRLVLTDRHTQADRRAFIDRVRDGR